MPCIGPTFLGEDYDTLVNVIYTLRKHGLMDAKKLDAALTAAKAPTEISVYDYKNNDRLLGVLPNARFKGTPLPHYEMAAYPQLKPMYYRPDDYIAASPMDYFRVTFTKDARINYAKLEAEVCLKTEAPLDILMRVDGFRLPGEDAEDAYRRRRGY